MDSVTKERQQLIKATFYGLTSSGLVIDESRIYKNKITHPYTRKHSMFDTLYCNIILRLRVKVTASLMLGLPYKTEQMNNHSSYNLSLL